MQFSPHLLRWFFPQRISAKLALVISLLMIILLSSLGFALTRITQDVLKSDIKTSHEEVAMLAASQIGIFVGRPAELLTTAAKLIGRSHANAWDQETLLVELSLDFPMFEEIVAVDQSGIERASSNSVESAKKFSRTMSFLSALQGHIYFSEIEIGEDYLPHMTISVPYYQMGKIAGVLIAKVNLRGMWDIADQIQIGKTGRAILIAGNGLFIAHPDKALVLQNKSFNSLTDFNQIVSGKTGSSQYYLRGKLYLISYAPVRAPVPMFVVIQRQASEAYGLLAQMNLLIWFVLFVSLFPSLVVSFLVAQWLVQPVKLLQEWSRKVAMGDFDFRISPKSLDEIGRLFIMFKRMSKRLKGAREKERFAALGIASTTISHKLKNSIVSLKTFSQLLPQRRQDEYFMDKFERNFTVTVDHLEEMFNNLSHVASSREPMIEWVNIPLLIQSLFESYAEQMKRDRIQFKFDFVGQIPEIRADREQLKELFTNLIQNSIQAMPGGGTLNISLHFPPPHYYLQMLVSDTGMGIKKQDLQQVFKPFFTTKHNGMGLGLAICKKIVENHGGSILIKSQEGGGTVFTIYLPVQNKKAAINPTIREPHTVEENSQGGF